MGSWSRTPRLTPKPKPAIPACLAAERPRDELAIKLAIALTTPGVGGPGCGLGLGLGTFVAITARGTTGSPELVVPWANLAVTAAGVPLLAALCTRSRLPLVRRAD